MIEKIVEFVADAITVFTLVSPIIVGALKYVKANTTNKRIQVLESYALRVVQSVEQQKNLMPSDKKKRALERMSDYIAKSPLKFKVTEKQLSDLIEAAVNKLQDTTTPGTVKESTAIDTSDVEDRSETTEDKEKEKALGYLREALATSGDK